MRISMPNVLPVLFTLMLVAPAPATEPPDGLPPVADLLGLETDGGHGWLAIRVDFEDSHALSGILWYNNDAQVTFPMLAVGAGYQDGPAGVAGAVTVATGVSGASDGWSAWPFDQPVAASLGGLYVILEFPAGSGFTGRGQGGGPAVGFCAGLSEPAGWISGDGETWHRLAGDFGFAMAPVLVPYEEGMLVKSLGDGADESEVPDIPREAYLTYGPNPFNPQVVIRFGLPRQDRVRLNVYDIRGRRVASGVYFARFQSDVLTRVERVTLVK